MLNITHYYRNENQNYNEVSPHMGQTSHQQKKIVETINAGGDVEKSEPSCSAGGNVSSYSLYGEQYGGSLKIRNI